MFAKLNLLCKFGDDFRDNPLSSRQQLENRITLILDLQVQIFPIREKTLPGEMSGFKNVRSFVQSFPDPLKTDPMIQKLLHEQQVDEIEE